MTLDMNTRIPEDHDLGAGFVVPLSEVCSLKSGHYMNRLSTYPDSKMVLIPVKRSDSSAMSC